MHHHVFAYLDPGSASIVFQALIAGVIAVPVIFRNRISAMVRAIRGQGTPETKEPAAEPAPGDTTTH
jgi:hypothetical protein